MRVAIRQRIRHDAHIEAVDKSEALNTQCVRRTLADLPPAKCYEFGDIQCAIDECVAKAAEQNLILSELLATVKAHKDNLAKIIACRDSAMQAMRALSPKLQWGRGLPQHTSIKIFQYLEAKNML